jgi:putative spermidine/putrescine transport system substrate-binding protein
MRRERGKEGDMGWHGAVGARVDRRGFLRAAAGGVVGSTILDLRALSWAQQALVVKTFTGLWNQGNREHVANPFEKKTGAKVTLVAINSVEAVARLKASRGRPPFDVLLVDEGPRNQAITEGLLQPMPLEKIPNAREVYPELQVKDGYGPRESCSVMGIAYDPKRVAPPQSWADLWSPAYKGKLALNPASATLGTAFLVVAARLNGGSEKQIEPGFQAIKRLLPSVVSIPKTPAVLATLLERGEVAVAPLWNTNTLNLKAKGVSVDWVVPKEGAIGAFGHAEIARGASNVDLALQYIDQHLSVESQTGMANSPYFAGPVNRRVRLQPEVARFVPASPEAVQKLQLFDWNLINEGRDAWLDRWDREIVL